MFSKTGYIMSISGILDAAISQYSIILVPRLILTHLLGRLIQFVFLYTKKHCSLSPFSYCVNSTEDRVTCVI